MNNLQIPYDAERHNGTPVSLYQRYEVKKRHPEQDGPDDPNAIYFVLRIDAHGKDPNHIRACQRAALKFAELVHDRRPELADDLCRTVAKCAAELPTMC